MIVTRQQIDEVLGSEARRYGVTVSALRSPGKRATEISAARSACCRRLRAMGLSYPRIGSILSLHHTSVLNAVRRVYDDCGRRVNATQRPIDLAALPPDLSGEWAI